MKTVVSLVKICLVLIMGISSCTMGYAQTAKNSSYRRGYHADVSIESTLSSPVQLSATTSHGYSWGNGLYVGGGTGLNYCFYGIEDRKCSVYLPVFADVKYSFINGMFSPFVKLRGGALVDYTSYGAGYFVCPSIGVDIWNFSMSLGCEIQSLAYKAQKYAPSGPDPLDPAMPVAGFSSTRIGETIFKIAVTYNF